VRAFLPDWTDEALQHKAGFLEVQGFLARHLGLRLRPEGGFDKGILPHACFKLRAGTTPEAVSMARQVATSVARIIAQAMEDHNQVPSFAADRVRELALASAQGNANWVDFPGLVEAAWEIGIPVVYLPNLGAQGKKPDGMVTYVAGRPVVVLLKKQECADWQLFTLAHELGHVSRGHLEPQEGAAIVDEKVNEPSGEASAPMDEQEAQANDFANDVLIPSGQLVLDGQWPKAVEFAAAAKEHGKEHGISPGHVVLNAVSNTSTNLYGLAQATLRILADEAGARSTSDICREALVRRINLGSLRDDTAEFLEKLKVV
jgi:Zn-dependent peptidase ImmA (M78 family)